MNKRISLVIVCTAVWVLTGCTGKTIDTEETAASEAYVRETVCESSETRYSGLDSLYFLNDASETVFKDVFKKWLTEEGIIAEKISVDVDVQMDEATKVFECAFRVYAHGSSNDVLGIYDMENEAWTFAFGSRPETEATFAEEVTTSGAEAFESLEEEARELSASYVPEPEDASLAPGYLSISNEAMLPESIYKDALLRDTAAYLEAMHDTRREVTIESVETDTSKPVVVFVFRTFLTDKEKLRVRWDVSSKSYVCSYVKGEKINETEKE